MFLIVTVLPYFLRVPMVVDDSVLRLCEVENSLLTMLGKEFHSNHPLLPKKATLALTSLSVALSGMRNCQVAPSYLDISS